LATVGKKIINGDITLAVSCQYQCATNVILFNISFLSSLFLLFLMCHFAVISCR